ncbi:MAG: V-type ATP synthase subunit I [Methanolinea sp.]|nr:V-type ATP synthase subunit I [Methanolinea sp.]
MFYPARMQKVTIGLDNTARDRGIEALHEEGVLQVVPLRETPHPFQEILQPGERDPLGDRCAELRVRIDRILEIFQANSPGTGNALKDLFAPVPTTPVTLPPYSLPRLFDEIEEALRSGEESLYVASEIRKTEDRMTTLEKVATDVSLLGLLPFDLSLLEDSRFLSVNAALLTSEKYTELEKRLRETCGEDLFLCSCRRGEDTVVVIASHASHGDAIKAVLRSLGAYEIRAPGYTGLPKDVLREIERETGDLASRKETLRRELARLRDEHEQKLLALREELMIRREEIDLLPRCGSTRTVTVVMGYAPFHSVEGLRERVTRATEDLYFIRTDAPDPEDESVPVDYHNPPWLAPFEFLTSMFARPRYNEIDPTPFIAPIFLVFFGLMLGDAGYGILIALVGFLLYRGAGRVSRTMHDLSFILTLCGISAIVFGAIQGGWFGDLPQRFLGISPPFVLIEPLRDPIAFFQISLLLGILHINLGLALAFFQNYRKKRYRACIFEQGVWYIIQTSAGILLTEFFGWAPVPRLLHFLALAGAAIGIGLIFYSHGPMGFFSLTGFLGDWLSYVRILALALATGGIAMTVNILAQIIGSAGALFFLPALAVLLGGQAFNLVIQTLGGVIHAIRLQYIEFFGKFYQGGGRTFTPFTVERVYSRRGDAR